MFVTWAAHKSLGTKSTINIAARPVGLISDVYDGSSVHLSSFFLQPQLFVQKVKLGRKKTVMETVERTLINSNSVRDTSRAVFTPFCSASYAVQWNWVRVRVCLSLRLIITPTDSDCCYRRAATCWILNTSCSFDWIPYEQQVTLAFFAKFVNK